MNPYIYSIIPRSTLKDVLTSFSVCTGIPIQAIDSDGNVVESVGDFPKFCEYYRQHICKDPSACKKVQISAGKRASELGESYIFSCPANLNNIVFPLMSKNTLFGTVLAGPFIMDDPDSLLLLDIVKKTNIGPEQFLDLYNSIQQVRIVPPSTVTQLGRLLYYLFSATAADTKEKLLINKGKLYQQSKINESIQKYKEFNDSSSVAQISYPYEKEKELIKLVKTGNTKDAKSMLNDLLGYTLFAEGSDLTNIRSRALELASLLSRAAIEGGAPTDSILRINNEFLMHLQNDINIDDMCYHLQEITEVFTESMFDNKKLKNSATIKKAIQYISKHYTSALTLEEVAMHVGLNPSYFSSYFKQMCGSSFKEYLNMVRIEEAKRLLSNTDYSILDIAIAIGFDNQSYFSKVFKKYTGLTPKHYR